MKKDVLSECCEAKIFSLKKIDVFSESKIQSLDYVFCSKCRNTVNLSGNTVTPLEHHQQHDMETSLHHGLCATTLTIKKITVPEKCQHLQATYYERFNIYICWKCWKLITGTQEVRKLFYNILYTQQIKKDVK